MLRIFGRSSRDRLSNQAREILEAARGRGEVFLLRGSSSAKWVACGSHHFYDPRNPSVTDAYLQGFQELQTKGFLVHDSGNHYRLAVENREIGKWLR